MKPLAFAPLLALPLAAQGTLFQPDPRMPPTLGIHVQAGFPQGAADRDLNRGAGYGASVSYQWHLGGRHVLRPNLEYNAYRIRSPQAPDGAPEADRTHVFRTWKAGMDYLLYQEPWAFRGPYVLVGVGFEHSKVDYQVQGGAPHTLVPHSSSRRAPWFGAGVGYQVTEDIALELRYSVAPYSAEKGQPLAGYTRTEPIRRDGEYVHLVLALRVPL